MAAPVPVVDFDVVVKLYEDKSAGGLVSGYNRA